MTSLMTPANVMRQARIFGEARLLTDGEILALAFATDGAVLSVEEPGVVRQWDTTSGLPVHWQTLSDLETSWTFSKDGKILASASDDLTIWDATSGEVLTAIAQESWVSALAFHPDSTFVATGHDDGAVRCWDVAGHNQVFVSHMHKRPISALAFSADGKFLAVACEDKSISLWDAKGKHIGNLLGHSDRIPALVWHPNGETLVSAGWDSTVRLWDVRTLEPIYLLNNHARQVYAVAISADGTLLASADSESVVHVFDFDKRAELQRLSGSQGEIHDLAFNKDGTQLAVSSERIINLWNPRTGATIAAGGTRPLTPTSVSVSPDGKRLATNAGGSNGAIWDIDKDAQVLSLVDDAVLHGVRYSPDGRWVAAAAGKHIRIWEAASGRFVRDLADFEEHATMIAFSSDGKLLASAGTSGMSVWLWRVEDGEPLLIIPDALDGCAITSFAFHPNSTQIAVGGVDWLATGGSTGAVSIWDLNERRELAMFAEGSTAIAFDPEGSHVAIATLENTICLWDFESDDVVAELSGHETQITALAYSPDGAWLVSAGEDRTLHFRNAQGEVQAVVELDSKPTSIAFSPDAQQVFTANANTTCYQFEVARLVSE